MKLKIGGKVYLQKYEVASILHKLKSFPASIMQETFGDGGDEFFCMNGAADGFRFDCIYKEPKNVEWLMDQDWIIDYDEYAKMPLDELKTLYESYKVEYSADIDRFNAKDVTYRETHFEEENDKLNKFWHKIASLGNLIGFREGEVKFVFPDEYRGETTVLNTSSTASATQKKSGFLARLFRRDAQ